MDLIGTFYNEAKKITFTFKSNRDFTLNGANGRDTENGTYVVSNLLNYAGYPITFELFYPGRAKLSIPVKYLNSDSFATLYNDFCVEDFNMTLHPAIFNRTKS
jgi:hypothetical protein